MARKGIQEKDLFNGHRRKIQFVGGATVFLDPQDNKHTRIKLRMPITSQPLVHTPEFVSLAYEHMEPEESAQDYVEFDRYMLGMSCFFTISDAKTSKKLVRLVGCELAKFYMTKEGVGDKAVVNLYFTLDVLGNKELYDHMWEHHNNINHVEFDFDQNSIVFPEEAAGEKEEEGQQDLPDTNAGKPKRGLVLTKPGEKVN